MGGQGDGASYTINLDTSAHAVEQTAPGNYRIPTLRPTINVPYAAVPTVMLTQASFTNTLTTISRSLYNNNIVDYTQVGYGLKGVAAPIISANSQWGGTVKIFE